MKITGFFILIPFILILDRITKIWALSLTSAKIVNSVLAFDLAFNRGINWGFFNSSATAVFWVINVLIAGVIIALLMLMRAAYNNNEPLVGYFLILGGALSNYFDRLWYGGVIDFIILSYFGLSWPAFNIADVIILIGISILAIYFSKK